MPDDHAVVLQTSHDVFASGRAMCHPVHLTHGYAARQIGIVHPKIIGAVKSTVVADQQTGRKMRRPSHEVMVCMHIRSHTRPTTGDAEILSPIQGFPDADTSYHDRIGVVGIHCNTDIVPSLTTGPGADATAIEQEFAIRLHRRNGDATVSALEHRICAYVLDNVYIQGACRCGRERCTLRRSTHECTGIPSRAVIERSVQPCAIDGIKNRIGTWSITYLIGRPRSQRLRPIGTRIDRAVNTVVGSGDQFCIVIRVKNQAMHLAATHAGVGNEPSRSIVDTFVNPEVGTIPGILVTDADVLDIGIAGGDGNRRNANTREEIGGGTPRGPVVGCYPKSTRRSSKIIGIGVRRVKSNGLRAAKTLGLP